VPTLALALLLTMPERIVITRQFSICITLNTTVTLMTGVTAGNYNLINSSESFPMVSTITISLILLTELVLHSTTV